MKNFIIKNSKHVVIMMWIINLFVTYMNIKHGMTDWQMFWNGLAFVACGFATYYLAQIGNELERDKDLATELGRAYICDEFRKFKGLSEHATVSTIKQDNVNYFICEGNKVDLDNIYVVVPGITEDNKPCIDFFDPRDKEGIKKHTEMMMKRKGIDIELIDDYVNDDFFKED